MLFPLCVFIPAYKYLQLWQNALGSSIALAESTKTFLLHPSHFLLVNMRLQLDEGSCIFPQININPWQLNCFRSPSALPLGLDSAALKCHGTSGVEESVLSQHRAALELCVCGDRHWALSPLICFVLCRRCTYVLCARWEQVSGPLEMLRVCPT